jgi:Lipoprotein LpqB beta-propeller domain/Sporulation and spore germination
MVVSMTERRNLVRAVATVAALGVALLLAGCVGIPSHSGVNPGPLVKNGQDPAPADIPLGPRHNASKTEMVNDFLQAATSAVGNYAVAREFLTAKAAQSWVATKSVLVREKPATPQDVGDNVVDYAVTTKASVNALGIYVEQGADATQTLSFNFVKVKGQWRISDLPNGIVLSRTSFETAFAAYPIYFFDPDFRYLVPDVRWFPSGSTVEDRIVTALIAGPTAWLQQGVVASAIPAGVQRGSPIVVRNSAAVVDFSASAATTKPQVRGRMRQQLEESLRGAGITSVSMTARGAPLAFPDSSESHAGLALPSQAAPLIQKGKQFGFFPGLQPIGGISAQIVGLSATAATLDRGQATAAVLARAGVYFVTGATAPKLVDSRPGLIAPSIDTFGYVWSVPASDPSGIQVAGADGVAHQVASGLPSDATVVALDVSRDGTRVLIYLSTTTGPRLLVAGVIRRAGIPTSLGDPLDLPVSADNPIDATWVDPSTVAALGSDSNGDAVTSYVLGGSPGDESRTDDAVRLVGGVDSDSLRLITDTGEVQELRASGWQSIVSVATLLATQQ